MMCWNVGHKKKKKNKVSRFLKSNQEEPMKGASPGGPYGNQAAAAAAAAASTGETE